ncbi:MAG: four helix bundle protein [Verrucomicrobiota bacterium]
MKTRTEYPFEKLRVWQAARELSKTVYLATSRFPQHEIYGLTSQCNRAAVSVAANLAEGSSRQSRKDQAHFSEIAYSSLMELACLLILAKDVGVLSQNDEGVLRRSIEDISPQLNALHRSQRARIS